MIQYLINEPTCPLYRSLLPNEQFQLNTYFFPTQYINKVFEKLAMQDSNKGEQPSMIEITLSLNDCLRHSRRKIILKKGSLCFGNWNFSVYGMLCTITDKDLKKSISVPVLVFVMTLLCGGVSNKIVCLLNNGGHMGSH